MNIHQNRTVRIRNQQKNLICFSFFVSLLISVQECNAKQQQTTISMLTPTIFQFVHTIFI